MADDASVAGTIAMEDASLVTKNPHLGEVSVRVEKVEPPTYVAYRWASAFPGEELREDNSTLVEFTLSTEGGKTRLRVVESGFASLSTSEETRDNTIKFNTDGWSHVFDALKKRGEEPPNLARQASPSARSLPHWLTRHDVNCSTSSPRRVPAPQRR